MEKRSIFFKSGLSLARLRRASDRERSTWLLITALFLAGCGQKEIRVYTVPKDTEAGVAGAAITNLAQRGMHWTLPPEWHEHEATGMRVASFHVSGSHDKTAEVTIIPFPGPAGTELENLNRWRGEIGLAPLDADLSEKQSVPVGSGEGRLYHITGRTAGGTNVATVAVMMSTPEKTWFFKLKGDAEVVTSAKPAFLQFLKSITFDAPAAVAQAPVTTNAKEAKGSVADPEWHVPEGWVEQKPAPMVLRSFGIKGKKGEGTEGATVSISSFPGTVGGPLANVNRWRAQLNLEPVEETALPKLTTSIDVLGGKAMLVDMTGTSKNSSASRMIAAMVPREGSTWFYKLVGDPALVGAQKEAFTKFVQTVRYPNG